MSKNIIQKFRSHRGVSMLLALVLLLVCTTVGAVALTAASASMGRYRANRNAQQEYLAVMSAAELIKKDFEELTFRGVYVKEVVTEKIESTDAEGHKITNTTTTTSYRTSTEGVDTPNYTRFTGSQLVENSRLDLSEMFYERANEEIKELNSSLTGDRVQECTFTFPGTNSETDETSGSVTGNAAYGIPAVYGQVSVSDDYLLKVELSLDENPTGSGSGGEAAAEDSGDAGIMLTMVFQPTWNNWPPRSVAHKQEKDVGITTDYTYYESDVTWSLQVISKGELANETEDDTAEPAAVNDAPDSYNKDTDAY